MTVKKRINTRRKAPASETGLFSSIDIRSVFYTVFLMSFFCFTVGVLIYVVFFRTVVSVEQALLVGQAISELAS